MAKLIAEEHLVEKIFATLLENGDLRSALAMRDALVKLTTPLEAIQDVDAHEAERLTTLAQYVVLFLARKGRVKELRQVATLADAFLADDYDVSLN